MPSPRKLGFEQFASDPGASGRPAVHTPIWRGTPEQEAPPFEVGTQSTRVGCSFLSLNPYSPRGDAQDDKIKLEKYTSVQMLTDVFNIVQPHFELVVTL